MSDEQKEVQEGEVIHSPHVVDIKAKRPASTYDAIAISMYGDTFAGYQKIGELVDLIPAWKDFYYQEKIKNPNAPLYPLVKQFNREYCAPQGLKFHPYPTQLRAWRKKWDLDIMSQGTGKELVEYKRNSVKQVLKSRDDKGELVLGGANDSMLEQGMRTLGSELVNDALSILRDSQDLAEIYTSNELMKRKAYAVNVFSYITKMVHGKAALLLKASGEKRENANFLMNLMAKATAGDLTDEEIAALETTYSKSNAQPV